MRHSIMQKIVPEFLSRCFQRALWSRFFSSRSEIWMLLITDSNDFGRLELKRGEFFQAFSRRKLLFSESSKMLTRSLNVLDF
jgi:hypothetical protein